MMSEEERIKILSKHLPKYYLDIYLYVLYEDVNYLPSSLKREGRRKVKQVELNKEIAILSVLLARTVLDLEEV